ncbi:PREDICTED: uncharacterized protein LOC104811081 isoform X3 [Tarenaya hassleriana]|uniref:uncharacterized protein LOC104811081 isoform X3 n=1 Tax=Tarenaya hassleriana TaxID=28532 RepID=UPI00053C0D5A|nr:PREDICTED: uncharacterized protein LOC104811081 isoform X3 [Tarenaya hassleriana]
MKLKCLIRYLLDESVKIIGATSQALRVKAARTRNRSQNSDFWYYDGEKVIIGLDYCIRHKCSQCPWCPGKSISLGKGMVVVSAYQLCTCVFHLKTYLFAFHSSAGIQEKPEYGMGIYILCWTREVLWNEILVITHYITDGVGEVKELTASSGYAVMILCRLCRPIEWCCPRLVFMILSTEWTLCLLTALQRQKQDHFTPCFLSAHVFARWLLLRVVQNVYFPFFRYDFPMITCLIDRINIFRPDSG